MVVFNSIVSVIMTTPPGPSNIQRRNSSLYYQPCDRYSIHTVKNLPDAAALVLFRLSGTVRLAVLVRLPALDFSRYWCGFR